MKLSTGSALLDAAMGGGLAPGLVLLAEERGAGAMPFVLTVAAAAIERGGAATCVSLSRSPERLRREGAGLLPAHALDAMRAECVADRAIELEASLGHALASLPVGGALVVDSAWALRARLNPARYEGLLARLANSAAGTGRTILLLHATGSLAAPEEARLAEQSDAILEFAWREGGMGRRRIVRLAKLPGLAPAMERDEVPLFEATVRAGAGFGVLPVKGVV